MFKPFLKWLFQPDADPEFPGPPPEDGADPRAWVRDVSRRCRNIERWMFWQGAMILLLIVAIVLD